jgi:putative ATPase
MADVRAGRGGAVPPHLRDAHYPGSRGLGHGKGYRYPHDDPRGVVVQQYVPDDLVGADYYQPTEHGAERAVAERLPRLRRIVRGLAAPARPAPATPATGDVGGSVGSSADGDPQETTVGSSAGDPPPPAQAGDAGQEKDSGAAAGKEQP